MHPGPRGGASHAADARAYNVPANRLAFLRQPKWSKSAREVLSTKNVFRDAMPLISEIEKASR